MSCQQGVWPRALCRCPDHTGHAGGSRGKAAPPRPAGKPPVVVVATYNIGANRDTMFSGPAGKTFTMKLRDDIKRPIAVTWIGDVAVNRNTASTAR